MRSPILYISYDGMLEPLGQSQVLAYLERLAPAWDFCLISFEKAEDWQNKANVEAVRERIAASGIKWIPLTYHKSPSAPATAYDVAVGVAVALSIVRRHGIRIVHARSYVAALMALAVKRISKAKLIFDMRGFWADERVDGGLWPRDGALYRTTKRLERTFLQAADHVVTLTHASKREIEKFEYLQGKMPPITVIPTCADLATFRPAETKSDGNFTLGYVGSVGTWYLLDELLSFFKVLLTKRPGATLLIVNKNEHDLISSAAARADIPTGRYEVISSEHRNVPNHIARMHAGAALIKPCYSKIASAPTKLAEYLGCGVPCVGNAGVGDMDTILEGERVGVALTEFSKTGMDAAIERLLDLVSEPGMRQRCVETANRLFSLDRGVEKYNQIYRTLSQ